ncbi:hypothetical protein A5N78_04640 [Prescottella equi]|uniref:hypothetical protein n=1 Tax=Rhodococcus hoagii TaxID=43767 RepID=UPI000A11532D|nr:hypothetical protein [Prescottella equi]ORL93427.1 hypothetical protein A5N78_04640 [Prescottella equi]ORM17780.1 hypothetical protein A5N70_11215 [Prescottella equi]
MKSPRSRRVNAQAAEKQERALQLLIGGATNQQVADQLGYSSRGAAHNAITKALAEQAARRADLADQALTIALERLDALWRPQYVKAIRGDAGAAETCLRILDRQIKLLGLGAPTRADVTISSRSELDVEVEKLLGKLAPRPMVLDSTPADEEEQQ